MNPAIDSVREHGPLEARTRHPVMPHQRRPIDGTLQEVRELLDRAVLVVPR